MYLQNYNPLGVGLLSILVAAVPILTLLYFVALHPHRDAAGLRHLGITAPWAAFAGVVAFHLSFSCVGMSSSLISGLPRRDTCTQFDFPLPWLTWRRGRSVAVHMPITCDALSSIATGTSAPAFLASAASGAATAARTAATKIHCKARNVLKSAKRAIGRTDILIFFPIKAALLMA